MADHLLHLSRQLSGATAPPNALAERQPGVLLVCINTYRDFAPLGLWPWSADITTDSGEDKTVPARFHPDLGRRAFPRSGRGILDGRVVHVQ